MKVVQNSVSPEVSRPEFPSYTSNYQKTVVEPQEAARLAQAKIDCEATGGSLEVNGCIYPEPVYEAPVYSPPTYSPYSGSWAHRGSGDLMGNYGYALPYGNCVDEPGVNNPGYGNPSSWPATSYSPWIGASALFTYNHVGVVTGIWSNGDVEVRHRNFQGGQTRFPRSAFRGYR